MSDKRQIAMEKLREAAKALAECGEDTILFPGWDFTHTSNETQQQSHIIRDAAIAIHGNTNYDKGSLASVQSVSALVRYIGDMLES